MSATGNGPATPPTSVPKGDKDKKGDDQTIAKVTGVVIASGIAWSLYKSFRHTKTTEHPNPTNPNEPFHEEYTFEKPEEFSAIEDKTKEKTGQLKSSADDFKSSAEAKGKDLKTSVEGKAGDLKSSIEAKGKDAKHALDSKAQDSKKSLNSKGSEVRSNIDSKGNEVKKSVDSKGNEIKSNGDSKGWEAKHVVEDKANQAKEAGKSFLNKVTHPGGGGKDSSSKDSKWSKGKKDYEIVRGDTLWGLSRRYGVTIDSLKAANGIIYPDYIVAGDTLVIPPK